MNAWDWIARIAVALVVVWFATRWRTGANKGLILSLLLRKGEQTGRQLRDAGVGCLVYNHLLDLEREGLVERRIEGGEQPLRGGLPLHHFRIRDDLRTKA